MGLFLRISCTRRCASEVGKSAWVILLHSYLKWSLATKFTHSDVNLPWPRRLTVQFCIWQSSFIFSQSNFIFHSPVLFFHSPTLFQFAVLFNFQYLGTSSLCWDATAMRMLMCYAIWLLAGILTLQFCPNWFKKSRDAFANIYAM